MPTMTQKTNTMRVLFRVCFQVGHWTFFSSALVSLHHCLMRAKTPGLDFLALVFSFLSLAGVSDPVALTWSRFSFSAIA